MPVYTNNNILKATIRELFKKSNSTLFILNSLDLNTSMPIIANKTETNKYLVKDVRIIKRIKNNIIVLCIIE